MDKIATLPAGQRQDLFQATATRRGLNPAIIEKDFWVCWVLKQLFSDPQLKTQMVFKGGTSLSKVFRLIDRFSEDIDLVLDWRLLGYGSGGLNPLQEFASNARRDRFNKEVNEKAARYIAGTLIHDLGSLFGKCPGVVPSIDPTDPQAINVVYPAAFSETYLRPAVRLEIGPLASWVPSHDHCIQPYAAEDFPKVFAAPDCPVVAIDAERTFWEKATILHQQAHRTGTVPSRYSRHYYDMFRLAQSTIRGAALANLQLLDDVAAFKRRFYPCAWARYEDARPGTLRLVPDENRLAELRRDYHDMRQMIFRAAPSFDEIVQAIRQLETEINRLRSAPCGQDFHMNKLNPKTDGSTVNIIEQNIAKLQQLFPDAFTEGSDQEGPRWKVDFDALRQVLGDYVEDQPERYSFTWNGKGMARRIAQTPSTGTLRPCPQESVSWDTTKNLFIEGDNLETLKLLQKSYHGRVKMIYIDPPYNTGKEFIYPDRYQDNLDTYLRYTKQIDDEGVRLSPNLESSGRYHTNWLNMMYPRLKLARNLLTADGLCFVSINDHEAASARKLCDEIFGEECFVAQLVWNTEGHCDNQYDIKVNHEYILLYAKNPATALGYVVDPNTREGSNLWKGFAENSITKNGSGNPPSEITLPYGFPAGVATLDLPANKPTEHFFEQIREAGYITRQMTQEHDVSYPIRMEAMRAQDGKLTAECKVFSGWANADKLRSFIAGGCTPLLEPDGSILTFYLSENGVIYYRRDRDKARNIVSVLRNLGTTEQMRSELERMGIPFQYPKPKQLIAYLLSIGADTGGIVMDFFAGSCTTAHAIYEMAAAANASNWRFIMVQLPEPLDPKKAEHLPGFEFCRKSGLNANIAEIGKERLRRVSKKILAEQGGSSRKAQPMLPGTTEGVATLDLGFKVFRLDSSNIKLWDADFDDLDEALFNAVENIKPDRTEADVLHELLLKYGLDLAVLIEERKICGKTVYIIGAGALIVCLAGKVNLDVVEGIAALKAELKPEVIRVVFRDAGFSDDVVKTNAVQILRQAGIEDVKSL